MGIESNFCILCGKNKNEKLERMGLHNIGEVVIFADCCKECQVVIHNLRRIYADAQRKVAEENQKKLVEKVEMKGG